jgi:hypothetical protein
MFPIAQRHGEPGHFTLGAAASVHVYALLTATTSAWAAAADS